MSSEMLKSPSEFKDSNNNKEKIDSNNNNNETISVRLARWLDHIKRLKNENTQHLLKEAETRLVQQQELHTKDLDELREHYETQLRTSREKMVTLFKSKLRSAELASQRDKEAIKHVLKTLNCTDNQIRDSESRVVALEQTNFTLNNTVRDLHTSLEIEKSEANNLHAEVNHLQEELAVKIEQHHQFIKEEADNSLSLEIAKLNHLLSCEEKRLKLSEAPSS